jgi:hypothetical protein
MVDNAIHGVTAGPPIRNPSMVNALALFAVSLGQAAPANQTFPPFTGEQRDKYANPATKVAWVLGNKVDVKLWVVRNGGKGQVRAEIKDEILMVFDNRGALIQIQNQRTRSDEPNPKPLIAEAAYVGKAKDAVRKVWSEQIFTEIHFSEFEIDTDRKNRIDNTATVTLMSPYAGGGTARFRVSFTREDGIWLAISRHVDKAS